MHSRYISTPRHHSRLPNDSSLPALTVRRIRTVVVDDSVSLREAISNVLEIEELANVLAQAGDGAEAVELAVALRPELVLMDVSMPVMTGPEAAAIIKQLLPQTRVALMSGEETEEVQQLALASGADAFLFKSGFPEDFLLLLEALFPHRFISS